ncbi:MAG: hypothetical protein IJ624_04115 [Prevotella sp.]|nr:hypothetical protein [Prevotella sp.]
MSFWINAAIWAVIIGVGMWKLKPQPLTAIFIVSLYIGLGANSYVGEWLPFLPTKEHILYYAIPASIFIIVSFFYCNKTSIKWSDATSYPRYWYFCVTITIWMSLPTLAFYDWHNAKIKYETEMEELFGVDWEDEVEEMKQELHLRP